MRLLSIRLVQVPPFDDLQVSFAGENGSPRPVTIVQGGGGIGKTSLLSAIASTRPGYCIAQPRARGAREDEPAPHAIASWVLGDDDPARPHPLLVASPGAQGVGEGDVAIALRREQALFDRRATEGGFALLAFSAARWFSRAPVILSAPDRTVLRYDVRAPASFDDATRADLARETKQALVYAAVGSLLATESDARTRTSLERLAGGMREAVGAVAGLAGYEYVGVSPITLEPLFASSGGRITAFDSLPGSGRHLVALAALTLRTLHAAYPDRDRATAEGLVLVDDAFLHQEDAVRKALVPTLRSAFPRVQWVFTTSIAGATLGCDPADVVALRRLSGRDRVQVYEGPLSTIH